MNPLQTNDLIALSLLLDEEIYVLNDEIKTAPKQAPTDSTPEVKTIEPAPTNEVKTTVVQKTTPPPIEQKSFDYLGENNKYILVIVNNPTEKFLNATDLGFLTKIMGAKKWTLDDVAIVNMAKYEKLDFENLKSFFACSKIVTFGFNPAVLNIDGAVANKKSMYKNVAVLGTWDLPKLQDDVAKKTVFWNQLKEF